ncbi:adenylosuccinate lyase [bacterium]|nr:adenylosuccinate lyase [bacterium]
MVERYTRKQMGELWTPQSRFENMMQVEVAVALVQGEMGLIPKNAATVIEQKASFQYERILEIEKETRHDVIAFVSNMAENIGPEGRYVHYGLTSSDVLDTALSVQIQKAGHVLLASLDKLLSSLKKIVLTHENTLCAGRTHGMHAEPTTFGYKMAGFYFEALRSKERIAKSLKEAAIGKLSGAVGTYSFLTPEFEKKVCAKLQLTPESVATQVIPRDRHAELMTSLALLGAGIERLATEIRHLQRTEVNEAQEGFSSGQKGSSAMPHKKNPIGAENLTGCARLLRGYALTAIENVALWHERDISHSSVERVIFPDAFILADYACDRLASLLDQLQINKEQMLANMNLSQGQLFSSHLLLHLVDQGLSREEGYKIVQAASHQLKAGENLKDKLAESAETKKYFDQKTLNSIFSGERHIKHTKKVFEALRGER